MKLQDVELEALALSKSDRAALVMTLLDTLEPIGSEVDDEEVLRRDREMETGKVAPMMHEDFVKKVQSQRKK